MDLSTFREPRGLQAAKAARGPREPGGPLRLRHRQGRERRAGTRAGERTGQRAGQADQRAGGWESQWAGRQTGSNAGTQLASQPAIQVDPKEEAKKKMVASDFAARIKASQHQPIPNIDSDHRHQLYQMSSLYYAPISMRPGIHALIHIAFIQSHIHIHIYALNLPAWRARA